MASSSSSVHLYFLMSGFRWLCHLYRHCLPILPGKLLAIKLQFLAPCSSTNFITNSSSSLVCIKEELPRVLWSVLGSKPFASDVDTEHQFFNRRNLRFFSNYEPHDHQPTFWVYHLLPESTIFSSVQTFIDVDWDSQFVIFFIAYVPLSFYFNFPQTHLKKISYRFFWSNWWQSF